MRWKGVQGEQWHGAHEHRSTVHEFGKGGEKSRSKQASKGHPPDISDRERDDSECEE